MDEPAVVRRTESSQKTVDRDAVVAAFTTWTARRQDDLNDAQLGIVRESLAEVMDLRTQRWDDWWIRNAWRYDDMREIDRRKVRMVMRCFLADLTLGKVKP